MLDLRTNYSIVRLIQGDQPHIVHPALSLFLDCSQFTNSSQYFLEIRKELKNTVKADMCK